MNTNRTRFAVSSGSDILALEGAEFVRAAYREILRRSPDPGGFVAYLERLRGGTTKEQVLSELQQSPEAKGEYFVSAHSQKIASEVESPVSLVRDTPEDLLKFQGTKFLLRSYLALLGRQADPAGLAYYQHRLATGVTERQVLAEIATSDEYLRQERRPAGVEEFLRQEAQMKSSLWRIAARLIRRWRPHNKRTTQSVQHALCGVTNNVAESAVAVSRSPLGMSQPANSARRLLLTLPDLDLRSPSK